MIDSLGSGYKIFISSTMEDLREERFKIAMEVMRSENMPIIAEHMINVLDTPRKALEKKVDECDGYIGVFHKRWNKNKSDTIPIVHPELLLLFRESIFYKGNRRVETKLHFFNGTLDIVISYDKILLNYHEICIESKSGQSNDLFQIERYLYESYLLIVVRVPTRDVVPIRQENIASELITGITSAIEKIDMLVHNNLLKVQGEWCRGCTADCEFKKEGYNKNHVARLEFEEFFKNTNAVTHETIRILKEEIGKFDTGVGLSVES